MTENELTALEQNTIADLHWTDDETCNCGECVANRQVLLLIREVRKLRASLDDNFGGR